MIIRLCIFPQRVTVQPVWNAPAAAGDIYQNGATDYVSWLESVPGMMFAVCGLFSGTTSPPPRSPAGKGR